jgi:hypothetical protein
MLGRLEWSRPDPVRRRPEAHPESISRKSAYTLRMAATASRPSLAFAIANGVFAVLFTFAVVVQYNDPDPIQWMLVYGAAAALSGWSVRRHPPVPVAVTVVVIALVWALGLVPVVIGELPTFAQAAGSMAMMAPGVEETREALGLAIVVCWLVVIAIASWRAK